MKKKNILCNTVICVGVVLSGVFCINSTIKLAGNMRNASAVSSAEDVYSVKNITVDNIDYKYNEIEKIDVDDLEYNDELSEFYNEDTYIDKEDSIYVYDEGDNLISYTINNDKIDKSKKITDKRALELSKEYLSHLTDDISKYSLQDTFYDTNVNEYNIVYGNKICGLKTSDIVYITINNKEELVGYSIPNAGKFDKVSLDKKQIEIAKERGKVQICGQYDNMESSELETTAELIMDDNDNIVLNVSVDGIVYTQNGEQEIMESAEIPLSSLQ